MAQRLVVSGTVGAAEGLRERKKRETRQHISDTATGLFLERGFDEVRVADVAAAAGVSEKTVYNYFETKEQLLLDREPEMAAALRQALGPGAEHASPIAGMENLLRQQLQQAHADWGSPDDPYGFSDFLRFTALIDSTPSLRAAQRDMLDRLVQVAAAAMAERAGVDPLSPEPQIAADALMGLWRIHFAALRRQAASGATLDEALAAVQDDLRRAARLLETGLWSFSMVVQGLHGRDQIRQAGETANETRKQVLAAMREARTAWRDAMREIQREAHRRH